MFDTEEQKRETCFIVVPTLARSSNSACRTSKTLRDQDSIAEEAQGLALAIELEVLASVSVTVKDAQSGYFFSTGHREMIGAEIEAHDPDLVIVNHTLSPTQQRNLEKSWKCKVIDRTALILEIFGARAQTKEGRLQVELASLEYQKSRLVRSWTHLERQRGGAGFMGGPGETQIELDRRIIRDRITKLKKELEQVRRTRALGSKARARVPFPVVALVGYTNAGKSTLFNTLTNASVMAEDLLFATLDPTLRRVDLPNGREIILSDTVGFISDLPTQLIAAFRATLEQVEQADLIVHVIDGSNPHWEEQRMDVYDVLKELGVKVDEQQGRIVEVYNKIDALEPESREALEVDLRLQGNAEMISARDGTGLDSFLNEVQERLAVSHVQDCFTMPASDGAALAWLHQNSDVLGQRYEGQDVIVDVKIALEDLSRFEKRFGYQSRYSAENEEEKEEWECA